MPGGGKLPYVSVDGRFGPVLLKDGLAKFLVIAEKNRLVIRAPDVLSRESKSANAGEEVNVFHLINSNMKERRHLPMPPRVGV
jgi:hypothetical protein